MILDLKTFSSNTVYHLLTQTVIPRPIAWVLTQNMDGNSHNLAPFSYFTPIASDPPLLLFSAGKKSDGSDKDTVINCLRESRFVIHITEESHIHDVQASAKELPYGESEIDNTRLINFSSDISLKRLADAPVAFACKLYQHDTIGNTPQSLIFAEVDAIYVNDTAITQTENRFNIDGKILSPLARMGGGLYAGLSELKKP